jgi:alkanesulfonate monooxygenase SsuD/methylene tetrahydromethanopterin reductase-like flavin-dependent oxidoreductase (luciferase family)
VSTGRAPRFGVLLLPTDPWPETVARAQHLEMLGFHHLWVYDHLSWRRYQDRPWLATYPWLTGLAASTERIRLGTMVANPSLRHPLVLAKDAMTIDQISDGRMTMGLGSGGTGFDATVLGQDPLTPKERIDRLEEYAPLLAGLLSGEIRDHRGHWYVVNEGRVLPGCVQRPRLPIAIAAGGRRGLTVAAEVGDAWITYGETTSHDNTAEQTERAVRLQRTIFEDRCTELGRDPADLDRIYLVGNTRERPLASIEAFADFVGRYDELGFTDIVIHDPRADDPVWNEPVEIVDEIADRFLSAHP